MVTTTKYTLDRKYNRAEKIVQEIDLSLSPLSRKLNKCGQMS